MISMRVSKSTMSGLKILQRFSPDNATLTALISQLVHKELLDTNQAILTQDGYHTLGDLVVSATSGVESGTKGYNDSPVPVSITAITNETVHFSDATFTSKAGGAVWRLVGAKK